MVGKSREFTWWIAEAGYSWSTEHHRSTKRHCLVFNNIEKFGELSCDARHERNARLAALGGGLYYSDVSWEEASREGKYEPITGPIHPTGEQDTLAVAVKRYSPLRYTGLFRTFADVTPTHAGMLAFAHQYGLLRRSANWYGMWQKQIFALRRALQIWDLWRCEKINELSDYFEWQTSEKGARSLIYNSHPGKRPESPEERKIEVIQIDDSLEKSLEAKAYRIAPFYLSSIISRRMRRRVRLVTYWDSREGRMRRQDIPANLLGAIWLLFEQAVCGNKEFKPCPICGTWIELSRTAKRSDAIYCSGPCRSKAYRDRQKRAQELWAEGHGKSFMEIAAELDVEEVMVKSWVTGNRRRTEK
jgi:hypothetical protein